MKIGVFGCSWTAGVYPEYYSWVKELACLSPNHSFHSYALGGVSNLFILHLHNKFKHLYDFNIIKLTSSARLSFYIDENNWELEKTNTNFYELKLQKTHTIMRFNSGGYNKNNIVYDKKDMSKFYNLFYKYMNEDMFSTQHQIECQYAKTLVNTFVFCHRNFDANGFLSTQDNIKDFETYIYDDGAHFNKKGAELEAQWIKNLLQI